MSKLPEHKPRVGYLITNHELVAQTETICESS